mgnify:CR=1 FL=1
MSSTTFATFGSGSDTDTAAVRSNARRITLYMITVTLITVNLKHGKGTDENPARHTYSGGGDHRPVRYLAESAGADCDQD